MPVGVSYDGKTVAKSSSGHSFQIHVGTCRSKSRGVVQAKTASTLDHPLVRFNYMTAPDDFKNMREGIRLAREICAQPALSELAGEEIQPGANVQSDEDLNAFIRQHAESAYHPCGTVRMGSESQETACVDEYARVIGVKGLRVCDASIFPQITNGNLNAPVIAVAEKVADHIQKGE